MLSQKCVNFDGDLQYCGFYETGAENLYLLLKSVCGSCYNKMTIYMNNVGPGVIVLCISKGNVFHYLWKHIGSGLFIFGFVEKGIRSAVFGMLKAVFSRRCTVKE